MIYNYVEMLRQVLDFTFLAWMLLHRFACSQSPSWYFFQNPDTQAVYRYELLLNSVYMLIKILFSEVQDRAWLSNSLLSSLGRIHEDK